MAGLAISFLLLILILQVAGATTARHAAEAAVAASARRASRPGADSGTERARLISDLQASLPGARDLQVAVTIGEDSVQAAASFRWLPPGPDWLPLAIAVSALVPRVVPP
jgi:hypothetical protein